MIQQKIEGVALDAIQQLYGNMPEGTGVQIEKTRKEFAGDFTLVVFPLLRYSRKSPQETAEEIGNLLMEKMPEINSFEVLKGFLNLSLSDAFWLDFFNANIKNEDFGFGETRDKKPVLIEYSSPNTNKPLHLGHIRNNLLGNSLARILKAAGSKVITVNLINDRGIHICKSMLAWMKFGDGETPESSGMKGDHLVGKYYVMFDKAHKKEIEGFVERGYTEDDAYNSAPLMQEAKKMLQDWEAGDEDVLAIWRMMNQWAYAGFDETYDRLGVSFDHLNYESKVYLDGKAIVKAGLEKGIFYRNEDGSVWVDLTEEGLDKKLLLRSDGTSVYITQDLGTAERRQDEFDPKTLIYVVGNEQIYHFDVLKKILLKSGRSWAENIMHLSYGMVDLPHGRMKSREGTVVDADELMDEMAQTAKKITTELGKADALSTVEQTNLFETIGLGALKYYMLKVDPKKKMLFNPEESIDFNGNTGPFIQYTYARIQSLIRKASMDKGELISLVGTQIQLIEEEKKLVRFIYQFPEVVQLAAEGFNPGLIANYCFDLVKAYNHFYQEIPVLKVENENARNFRLALSLFTGEVIKKSMNLLGIDVPDSM